MFCPKSETAGLSAFKIRLPLVITISAKFSKIFENPFLQVRKRSNNIHKSFTIVYIRLAPGNMYNFNRFYHLKCDFNYKTSVIWSLGAKMWVFKIFCHVYDYKWWWVPLQGWVRTQKTPEMHDLECASNSLKILAPDFEKQKNYRSFSFLNFFCKKKLKSDNERNSSIKWAEKHETELCFD